MILTRINARIPRMVMTITSSINVKPLYFPGSIIIFESIICPESRQGQIESLKTVMSHAYINADYLAGIGIQPVEIETGINDIHSDVEVSKSGNGVVILINGTIII